MTPEALVQDVRIGFRLLFKERLVSGLAVLVLAVGISAVTTQFSLINGVMLRGFSFPTADRLVDVSFVDPSTATAFGVNRQMFSMDFEEFRAQQQSFERMVALLDGSTVNMTIDGQPRRFTGAYTTADFFRILGVQPMRGRDFTEADNRPGAEKVAIIGYGLWQREFGGAEVVGKGVQLNGKPATIIGIMPQGFVFPQREELWIPLYSEFPVRPRNDPQGNNPRVVGLLKPGVSLESAEAEFTAIARRFAAAYPDTNKAFNTARVEPLLDAFTDPVLRGTLLTMLAFCVGLLAHRVRERDEHAVRAGDAARERAGGAFRPGRHGEPADPPDADRKRDPRGPGGAAGCRPGVPVGGLALGDHPEHGERSAGVDGVRHRPPGARRHGARRRPRRPRVGAPSRVDGRARERGDGAA